MKNPKAKKISLTADMREYLTKVLRNNRDLNELQLKKSGSNRDTLLQSIANDTIIIQKLSK